MAEKKSTKDILAAARASGREIRSRFRRSTGRGNSHQRVGGNSKTESPSEKRRRCPRIHQRYSGRGPRRKSGRNCEGGSNRRPQTRGQKSRTEETGGRPQR